MLKNLTIYDNIILPAYQSGNGRGREKRKEINSRAKELMHKLGISEIAEHDINEVSGGQLQRACICRSLINSHTDSFFSRSRFSSGPLYFQKIYSPFMRIGC